MRLDLGIGQYRLKLPEDEMGHFRFEVPVDYRKRYQVERSVRNHQHKNSASYGENRSKHESRDRSLFGASESLDRVVGESKPNGSGQDNKRLSTHAVSEKFPETFE